MSSTVDEVKAEFHALYWHLGPFGRQDVHLHPRIDREGTNDNDVLVGFGRQCEPKRPHVQKRLAVGAAWSKRDQEGQPLEGATGKTPKPAPPPLSLDDVRQKLGVDDA